MKINKKKINYQFPPLDYKPFTFHMHILAAMKKYRYIWACAGVGSGKTYLSVIALGYHLMSLNPGKDGLIICPTYKAFLDNMYPIIQKTIPPFFHYYKQESRLEWNFNGVKSNIYVRTATDLRAVSRIQGLSVAWVIFDEPNAAVYGRQAMYEADERLRVPSDHNNMLMTGSPKGRNWLCDEFDIVKNHPEHAWTRGYLPKKDHYIRVSTSAENTTLKSDYVKSLRIRLGERLASQELNANIISESGMLYDDFTTDMHVIPKSLAKDLVKKAKYYIAGVDFGFRSKSACLVLAVLSDNTYVAIDEIYLTGSTAEWLGVQIKDLQDKYSISKIYADNEDPGSIYKYRLGYIDNGLKIRLSGVEPADKRNFLAGRDTVRSKLAITGIHQLNHPNYPAGNKYGQPSLFISEECTNLINEFQTCRYEAEKQDKPPSERTIGDDHLLDCLRYSIVGDIGYIGLAFPENNIVL